MCVGRNNVSIVINIVEWYTRFDTVKNIIKYGKNYCEEKRENENLFVDGDGRSVILSCMPFLFIFRASRGKYFKKI